MRANPGVVLACTSRDKQVLGWAGPRGTDDRAREQLRLLTTVELSTTTTTGADCSGGGGGGGGGYYGKDISNQLIDSFNCGRSLVSVNQQ